MLPRDVRLSDSAGFASAVRRGRRAGGPLLVVHLGERTGDARVGPQVGFVVSRAVGNAVTRNLVKRRLRHLVRERLAVVDGLPGTGVLVVRALPGCADATYGELRAELDRCLGRVVKARKS